MPAYATLASALGLLAMAPMLWILESPRWIAFSLVPLVLSAAVWGSHWRHGPPYWLRLSSLEKLVLLVGGVLTLASTFLTLTEGHPYEFGWLAAGAIVAIGFFWKRGPRRNYV